jgi:hypothetical protein
MLRKVKSDYEGYEKYVVEGNMTSIYSGEILYRGPKGWFKKGHMPLNNHELAEVREMEKKFSQGNGNRQIEKIGWLVTFILDHHEKPSKELSEPGAKTYLWRELEREDPEFLEFYSGLTESTRYKHFIKDVNQAKEIIGEAA